MGGVATFGDEKRRHQVTRRQGRLSDEVTQRARATKSAGSLNGKHETSLLPAYQAFSVAGALECGQGVTKRGFPALEHAFVLEAYDTRGARPRDHHPGQVVNKSLGDAPR